MRPTLILAAFLFASPCSHACTCSALNPVCSAYWQTPVVFLGKVVERELVSHTETTVRNLDGSRSTVESPGYYRVRFLVLQTFRGEPQQEITILTNEQGSACGFSFEDANEYVVFASPNQESGEFWTSTCTLTHKVEAGKDDTSLKWMRALPSALDGATIFGRLVSPSGFTDETPPATISIRGAEDRDATPDAHGRYVFSGVAPGEYNVFAEMPPGFAPVRAMEITVANKGCAEVDWPILYDSHIRGRVTDATGNAMNDVFMVLKRRDSRLAGGLEDVQLQNTDPRGRYDFSRIPPGDYLVSANNLGPSPTRPYPRVYYPNADSDGEAGIVHLDAASIVENVDVTLPNAWKQVVVYARVLQPNGSPAIGADVSAYDTDYTYSGEPANASADAQGRAALVVYDGRTYYLTATVSGGTQQRCAGPLKFTAKNGMALDTITIEHDWGNCLAQLSPNFTPPR